MSRRKAAPKREILPDPKFLSERVAKFINCLMTNGKRSTAERMVYGAFDLVSSRLKLKDKKKKADDGHEGDQSSGEGSSTGGVYPVIEFFESVLDNVRPTVEVRSRRVGGATYQIPMEVRNDRGLALAMRWIIESARARHEKGFIAKLAGEFIDVSEGRGESLKKRENTHRMAKANQAFAHYRW